MDKKLQVLFMGLTLLALVTGQATPSPSAPAAGNQTDHFNTEVKLIHDLMTGYSKSVRPVSDPKDTLTVPFGFVLLSLDELEEKSQMMTVHGWMKMSWTDEQLKWDPAQYDGLTQTRIPMSRLWSPDITQFDHSHQFSDLELQLPIVYSSGMVFWIPKVDLKARCYVDMYDFPKDKHLCQLTFGSWTYHDGQVNMTLMSPEESLIEPTFFSESLEWEIVDTSLKRNAKIYPCCAEKYVDITYNFTLARRHAYHTHLFVAPSVVMALLIPFVFFLPAESHEKTIFGLGLLLGNVVMLGQMETYISGPHPIVPRIGVYYLVNIVLLGFSLGFSALVTNIWHRSTNRKSMPGCVRGFVGLLGKLLCVNRDDYLAVATIDNHNGRHLESMSGDNSEEQGNFDDMKRFMNNTAREAAAAEWRQLAIVIDRLLLVIFFFITIITTISVVR